MKNVLQRTSKVLGTMFFGLLAVLVLACIIPSQNQITKVEAAAKISKSSLTLPKGSSESLKVNGNNKKVTWKSTNSKVVAVNAKGKVTAKKNGSAKVQAKIGKKTYTCTVKVLNFKLNKTNVVISSGKTTALKVSGTKSKVSYKTSNTKVATVTSKGVIKGIKKGSTTIKVKVGKETYSLPVKVESPSLSKTSLSLKVGNTYQLKLNGTSRGISWSTNNAKVATVQNGKVTAKKAGEAIITAKVNDKSFTCKVKVAANVSNVPSGSKVMAFPDTINVKYGETKQITTIPTEEFDFCSENEELVYATGPLFYNIGRNYTLEISGKSVGTTYVVLKGASGWTKKCKVVVSGNEIVAGTVANQISSVKVNNIKGYKSVETSKHNFLVYASFTPNVDTNIKELNVEYEFCDKNGTVIATRYNSIKSPVSGKTYETKFEYTDYSDKSNSITSVKVKDIQVYLADGMTDQVRTSPEVVVENKIAGLTLTTKSVTSKYGMYYYNAYKMEFALSVKNDTSSTCRYKVLAYLYDSEGKQIGESQELTSTSTSANATDDMTRTLSCKGSQATGKIAKIVLRVESR